MSLRSRLTAAAAAAIALVLAAAGVLLVWRLRAAQLSGLDDAARQQAVAVAATVDGSPHPHLPARLGQPGQVQVLDAAGAVVASSPDIVGEPPSFRFRPAPAGAVPRLVTTRLAALNDAQFRVAAVATAGVPRFTVYVGLPTAPVAETTAELVTALAIGGPAVLLLFTAGTWWLVGRALLPVERLRRQAAEITVSDLHQRLEQPPGRDAFAHLATTLNDVLGRLDESVRRQREFVADAAHELRSPVAAIRAQLEAADHARRAARPSPAAGEAARLSALVDDLLALARLDAQPHPSRAPIDLDDIVVEETALLRGRSPVRVDIRGVSPARVLGDPGLLGRALRNVLDNAARYATATVTVTLCRRDGRAVLAVVDDGPGIPAADRARVFGRFTRLDDSRTRNSGGVGLGLAIVHDIVQAHAGTVRIVDGSPGTRVEISLPDLEPS